MAEGQYTNSQNALPTPPTNAQQQQPQSRGNKPRLMFHCQLAHGSPTGVISGFTNVKELYSTVAECFDIKASDVLFITLNSHKPDMNRLLGGQIGLEDFLFIHVKGQRKHLKLKKVDASLGVTITDNGAGYAFIKRIREGSMASQIKALCPGDHIEKINDVSMVGKRHFEVANVLKDMAIGTTFSLTLVEPMKSGFSEIERRSPQGPTIMSSKKPKKSGKETLRLRSKGPATVEECQDVVEVAIAKINSLLENYMGISDTELAQSIWEVGAETENPHDFANAMSRSDLESFGFTEDYIFDMWGAINDAKLSCKGDAEKGPF